MFEGGSWFFHNKRIRRRAISEAKETIFFCLVFNLVPSSGIPKIAIEGDGSSFTPNISEITLKKDCQYSTNLGHDQNMCVKSAGA